MIHLVTLNPALDFSFDLASPKSGKIGKVSRSSVEAGGKALNIARFLKAVKIPFTIWLGTGAGNHPTHILYRSLLSQEKLKVHFLGHKSPIRSNVVLDKDGKVSKFNHPGYESQFPYFDQLHKKIKKGDWVVLTGRLPQGDNEALYASWIDLFNQKGARTLVDTSGPALALALKAKVWFFKVNRFEISEILSPKLKDLKQSVDWVRKNWLKKGFGHGAITDGSSGAILWRYPECFHIQSPKVTSKMVVGAGDGFLAGCLMGLHSKKSLVETGRLAAAFGMTVAQEGIHAFTSAQMKKNCRVIKVRRVL